MRYEIQCNECNTKIMMDDKDLEDMNGEFIQSDDEGMYFTCPICYQDNSVLNNKVVHEKVNRGPYPHKE